MIEGLTNSLNVLDSRLDAVPPAALSRFESILNDKIASPFGGPVDLDEPAKAGRDDEVYEAAEQLVASAFIAPLLEQMRATSRENDMFYGGSTEDLFGHQLDERLADGVVKSSRFGLVDAVYREISGLPRRAGAGRLSVDG